MRFHDLRYAFRMLRKDWAFTVVAVMCLALGTGANSTMFSLVNSTLLRPLAVSRPSEILTVAPRMPGNPFDGISYPDYVDFRERTMTMRDLVASALFRFGFSPSGETLPKAKYGLLVSGNLFQAMGVTPVLGLAFRPEEDQLPGRDAVVVLGHDFWRDELGRDPHVVGRTVRLNGLDFTVIGVAPETFTGMDEFFKATIFVPAMMAPRLSTVARAGKYVWMTEAPTEYLYLPLAQNHRRQRILIAESFGDAASLAGGLRELVRRLDPNMPIFDVRTMENFFATWVAGSANTATYIMAAMGLTGLVLSMIGLYGLVS